MSEHVLITGSSGAIGKEIALKMAASGRPLFLHYNASKEKAESLKRECEGLGVEVNLVQSDLSKPEGVSELLKGIHSPVGAVIHNSGKSSYGLFTDLDSKDIQDNIQLHLTSPLELTKSLLPGMIQRRHGHILVISSIWGLTGAACEVMYSTVKGGLNTFVKSLAKEAAPSGVYVNGIAPGAIESPMMSAFSPEEKEALRDEIPMSRLGSPREVADAAEFLLSSKSSYISGQILSVNGAWYC
ncbi:elongation factor P 5-aminopentanone reductase [Thalassorhabdus alkalitolerans]|uniref:Elongation factor P 5-aminopentanone reductase n=1 Tax=Thalassorhabdus alkalitolerans TaxID=2282697 RepID=A0ABW0YK36_9BACI